MSRAYDDVFSRTLLDSDPALNLVVHVMRDAAFEPQGVALEVAPAGIPRVKVETPRRHPWVVLHWGLDRRSTLLGGEELVAEPLLHPPSDALDQMLRAGMGPRVWCGRLEPTALRVQNLRDEVRAILDPEVLPREPAWRVAWGYELAVATPTLIEDLVEGWIVIESA